MRNPAGRDVAEAVRREVRAWRTADLERHWDAAAVRAATRAGALTRALPGILVATEHADSFAARAHAAHLWCGDDSTVIGEGAAAAFDLCDVPARVIIATHYGLKRPCPPWLTLRRLPTAVPRTFWGVLPVAVPAWAAVTSYAHAPERTRDRFIYRAVQAKLASPDELIAAAQAIPRLCGRKHLVTVIDATMRGSESHLETVGLRRVFNTADFADFLRQHWVRTPGGNFRLDMFHPASRTAVELDGAGDHSRPERRQADINRDVHVARIGILTLRLSSHDIFNRAAWCREAVIEVVGSRR